MAVFPESLRVACSRPTPVARTRWPGLFDALRDETETDLVEGVVAAELLSGIAGEAARFELLARNVGPASTEIAYELVTSAGCFHREFSDQPDDGGQRSVRSRNVSEFRGLAEGLAIESTCDHALYPTVAVTVRGVAPDARPRIVAGLEQAFSSVVVR